MAANPWRAIQAYIWTEEHATTTLRNDLMHSREDSGFPTALEDAAKLDPAQAMLFNPITKRNGSAAAYVTHLADLFAGKNLRFNDAYPVASLAVQRTLAAATLISRLLQRALLPAHR
jgi:hypothetical protein